MKILIYGINFHPEITGIGKYSGELADWLVDNGHEIKVITAPPYYPAWAIGKGYKNWYVTEKSKAKNYTISRCPLWVPKKPSGIKRLLHLFSFAISTFPSLLLMARWRPDAVFVVEPALLCVIPALLFGKITGAKTWLHVQDFEIDAAFSLGLINSKTLRTLALKFETNAMQRFSMVSTISRSMVNKLDEKKVCASKTYLLPNWVDVDHINPDKCDQNFREKIGIGTDKIVCLYSGNMGNKQGLEILSACATYFASNEELFFLFCGEGSGRAKLEAECLGLRNVRFIDLQPLSGLPALLTSADIHLLPQRADVADMVMPSKLTGMLASGKPVVATAAKGTEVHTVVANCGIVVTPENLDEFTSAIRVLAGDAGIRRDLGRKGREFARAHLSREMILRNFETRLKSLISDKSLVAAAPKSERL